jgi:hypothetical protein
MKICRAVAVMIGVLFLTAVPTGNAQAANPADFSVAGVRLYMTPPQVLAALTARNVRKIQVIRTGCYRDVATAITRAKDPGQITIDPHCIGAIRSATTQIAFIEDYPLHPGAMRVYSIEYTGTSGDADAFKALLRNRYGAPTWSWDDKESWCAAPPGPIKEMFAPIFSDPCGVNEMPIQFGPDLNGTIGDIGTLNTAYPAIALEASIDSPLRLELHDKRFAYIRSRALLNAQDAAIRRATRIPL